MSRGYAETRVSEQIRTLFQAGALGALTDGQLLDRYSSPEGQGSEMAFAALVERHGPMVLGVCRRLLPDAHLSEDAFQATFLVLARRARSVKNHDSLGGWLHRVARRIAMRLRSKLERRKARERPGVGEVAVEYADRVERDELKSVIDQEIDRLAESHRLPVVLCCLEGISHEEASQRLRWPLGTVKSRLARGRKRLQERLVRRGFAPSAALAAAGLGLLGGEASAAVPAALIDAVAKSAAAVATGGSLAGVVPAALAQVVREELSSMIATKLKLAVGIPVAATAASVIFMGFVLSGAANQHVKVAPVIAAAIAAPEEPKGKTEAPKPAAKLSATGTVVDEAGRPIAGARVILREWSVYRARGMPPEKMEKLLRGEELRDTLIETTTDVAGQFRLHEVPAPAFPDVREAGTTVFPWDVAALADGKGLAWTQLTPQRERTPITLTLGPEGTIRGRVVETGGIPVVGAKIKVLGIDPLDGPLDNGLGTINRFNLMYSAFPLGAATDRDGRFTIRGMPRDRVATLVVNESRHQDLFAMAATTDTPQPEKALDGTRWRVYTGDFTLTVKRADHVLNGRIVAEPDGKPAAGAHIMVNGSRLKADENGRFRIDHLVTGKLELHATLFGSNAAQLDTQIEIPENPTEIEHTFALPRGMIITGRIIDGKTGAGVEKVPVEFSQERAAEQPPILFASSTETDSEGRYRLVAPPGRGMVIVQTIPAMFAQPARGYVGQPPDPKFSREAAGVAGQTIEVGEFKLQRGRELMLQVLDTENRPVADAQVDIRDFGLPPGTQPGRTGADGRSTLVGLSLTASTVVDITAASRTLGATTEIPEPGSPVAGNGEIVVRLQPLVSLSGRVLDEAGKPITGPLVHLYRNVIYPGESRRSFGLPLGTLNETKADGTFTFDHLIPGATYNTMVEASGYPNATSAHVTVKPGQSVRLDDFRLPAVNRALNGIVVDPRGKPLPGFVVSLDRTTQTRQFYAPSGGVWFQDSDDDGRFHLNSLPRGPIRLMVYHKQEGAGRQIKGIRYFDVRDGQSDIRIEMPDENDRLRGID